MWLNKHISGVQCIFQPPVLRLAQVPGMLPTSPSSPSEREHSIDLHDGCHENESSHSLPGSKWQTILFIFSRPPRRKTIACWSLVQKSLRTSDVPILWNKWFRCDLHACGWCVRLRGQYWKNTVTSLYVCLHWTDRFTWATCSWPYWHWLWRGDKECLEGWGSSTYKSLSIG